MQEQQPFVIDYSSIEREVQERRDVIDQKLQETGEKQRIQDFIRESLTKVGFRDELKEKCKQLIIARGKNNYSAQELFEEIKPSLREMVPQILRQEVLVQVETFVKNENI